jgi:hypothetical protein
MKYIELTKGQRTMVDDEDYNELNKYRWCAHKSPSNKTYYAIRFSYVEGKQKRLHMHRVIMNTPDGMFTDHINGNGLDNRKYNLRICTNSQNQHNTGLRTDNTSGYKGVSWHKKDKKWLTAIQINKKRVYLGSFETAENAYTAYCNKAKEVRGEFARVS